MTKQAQLLRQAYWKDPDDIEALRVWADALSEEGDPRGEFIILNTLENKMTPDQKRRYEVLKRQKGEMAGPARDYLRSWKLEFGLGLVEQAVCEATQLAAGFEHIRWLNPRLRLRVNAIKKPQLAALAKLELGAIHSLYLQSQVIDDAWFARLDLAGVKELELNSGLLTEAAIPSFARLRGLVRLVLDDELVETPGVRKKISRALPSLEEINGEVV